MFLGMVMVLGLLGVVVMVRMYSDIKKLKRRLRSQEEINQSLYQRISEIDGMINRRIDGEIDRTDRLYTEVNKYINSRIDDTSLMFDEVYRQMDSRLDKLVKRLNIPYSPKELLND